jgi:hypothetical protein
MGAIYAFCFVPIDRLDGLKLDDCGWDSPVRIESAGGVAAVAAEVPPGLWDAPRPGRPGADLGRLLPQVQAHRRVVSRTMSRAPAFPLPFGTLYPSRPALLLDTARRRRVLRGFFAAMEGREEWAVKLVLDRGLAIEARVRALFPDPRQTQGSDSRASPLGRRQRVQAERGLGDWLCGEIEGLRLKLGGLCESLVARPAAGPAVAHWACLVGPGGGAALAEAVALLAGPLADRGVALHCSGPSPLYSFRDPRP